MKKGKFEVICENCQNNKLELVDSETDRIDACNFLDIWNCKSCGAIIEVQVNTRGPNYEFKQKTIINDEIIE